MPIPSLLPALVLAAGLSRRMGAFKPLLPLRGKPVIRHTLDALAGSGAISETIVVVGHRAADLQAALAGLPQVRTVFNPHYEAGEMLSSIQAGVAALPATTPAFLLALADQPAVPADVIAALVKAAGLVACAEPASDWVAPTYQGKRGHPVLLAGRLIPAILALPAGETLRTVLNPARSTELAVLHRAVLEDLDTPEDLARAEQ